MKQFIFVLIVLGIFGLVTPVSANCGNFIERYNGRENVRQIDNCENPFNADENFINEPKLYINGIEVTDGSVLSISLDGPVSTEVAFKEIPFSYTIFSYKRDGADFVIDHNEGSLSHTNSPDISSHSSGQSLHLPGEYTVVVSTINDAPVLTKNPMRHIFDMLIPTAYAFFPEFEEVKVFNFTIESPTQDLEPLSDLLLQYEPILQFHEDEDYYPMNLEAFVENSSLWESNLLEDNLLVARTDNKLDLKYLATTTTDTSDWYVSFSSDEPGEFDLQNAKARYDNLVAGGEAVPTYYAHETIESYIDDLGNEHEFIVLQYWYFYAMNNWKEKEGQGNNHEGDWESIFVFLSKDSKSPRYVAFSAHHNDGSNEFYRIDQYESVRRSWDATENSSNQVTAYVSAGSHAKYPHSGIYFTGLATDDASGNGSVYGNGAWQQKLLLTLSSDEWIKAYAGKFGTDKKLDIADSSSGPRGPLYSNVSGTNRFLNPLRWAGIDRITSLITENETNIIDLPSQNIVFGFAEPLPAGTSFVSVPHYEFISFGTNLSTVNLMPKYWNINLSQPNGTFSVLVTVSYSDEEVSALAMSEERLSAYHYNPDTNSWDRIESTVDIINNTVSFVTDHFSIYSIGEVPETPTNHSSETSTSTATTTDSVPDEEERHNELVHELETSNGHSTRTDKNHIREGKVLGAVTSTEEQLQIEMLLLIIELLTRLKTILS